MTDPTHRRRLRRAEKELAQRDPRLGRVIARVGPCQLAPTAGFAPFPALARAICHQQLHGKAAETIHARVAGRFGDGQTPELSRVHRARLPSLRACGLSEAKALALKDLARKCLDGTVPPAEELHALDDDAVVARVTQVRGVGRWTVEMMLMFHLGRLDVFPVDDFGVRKGFMLLTQKQEPLTAKALIPHGEAWRPWRSVASWYLWRVADGR